MFSFLTVQVQWIVMSFLRYGLFERRQIECVCVCKGGVDGTDLVSVDHPGGADPQFEYPKGQEKDLNYKIGSHEHLHLW